MVGTQGMNPPMISLAEIRQAASAELIFTAVRESLIAHAQGSTQVPPPTHLLFPRANGDCHVKAGQVEGLPYFTVKVASGFYGNAALGLPTNNGLLLALSAQTGALGAVLVDEGWITAWRTAAAGALITDAMAQDGVSEIGVLGTGLQAKLQVQWLHCLRSLNRVQVWGRNDDAAQRLAAELREDGIEASAGSVEDAAGQPCVITATAARSPLAPVGAFREARHITALGADMPGKHELPPSLFAKASVIATDDHAQCLEHGDFGAAVREGYADGDADLAVGSILRDGVGRDDPGGQDHALSIADLTGVGATDTAVANAILSKLNLAG